LSVLTLNGEAELNSPVIGATDIDLCGQKAGAAISILNR
jgi:hypothetical protein